MTTPDRHFDFKQNALPKRGKGILLLQVLGGSMIGELLGATVTCSSCATVSLKKCAFDSRCTLGWFWSFRQGRIASLALRGPRGRSRHEGSVDPVCDVNYLQPPPDRGWPYRGRWLRRRCCQPWEALQCLRPVRRSHCSRQRHFGQLGPVC